ncbi:hypothetical protein SUDANB121_00983 [Nocardiopsis dassonvillei]|uniref:hypothetical protein n=1 Tax=Nocardiopsis dassonvillei TaxID=2014 RepID=UPI003F55814E
MTSSGNRPRDPIPFLAAVAALTAATACGVSAADGVSIEEQAAALVIELPMDDYRLDSREEADYFRAQDLLVDTCMEEAGFDWPVAEEAAPAAETQRPHRRRYGVVDPDVAEELGYHWTPSPEDERVAEERTELLEDAEAATAYEGLGEGEAAAGADAADTAATGNGPKNEGSGCLGLAVRELSRGADEGADYELFTQLDWESLERSERHPDVVAAMEAWSSCMADRGHSYPDVWSAMEDRRWNLDAPEANEAERATAVTDVACKYQTGLLDTWIAAEGEIQREMVEDHAAELETIRDANTAYARNAEAVLTESAQ